MRSNKYNRKSIIILKNQAEKIKSLEKTLEKLEKQNQDLVDSIGKIDNLVSDIEIAKKTNKSPENFNKQNSKKLKELFNYGNFFYKSIEFIIWLYDKFSK